MTHQEYIEMFMDRSFEDFYDQEILNDKEYILPKDKIHDYIKHLLSIPYIEFIDYVSNVPHGNITDDQLTQCSAFTACTDDMCKKLDWHGNPGLHFVEIGRLFPDYITQHTEVAYRKYGENQVKTASQLGLTYEYFGSWYLSCIGYVFNELSSEQKRSLLARTVLRVPLYRDIALNALEKEVDVVDYMQSLSDSTKGRRSGSILKLVRLILDEYKKEDITFHHLYFPAYCAKTKALSRKKEAGTYGNVTRRLYSDAGDGLIPLYTIRAACGYFNDGVVPEQEGWVDVSGLGIKPNSKKHFVVHAKGYSMLPKIKDGDLCVFEWLETLPDNGDIVLTQCSTVDNEYGGMYTIKKIVSEKVWEGGEYVLKKVNLIPLNTVKYKTISLIPNGEAQYRAIGALKAVISNDN